MSDTRPLCALWSEFGHASPVGRGQGEQSPVRTAAAAGRGGERGLTNGKRRSTKHEKDPLSEPIVRPNRWVVGLIAQGYRANPAIEQAVWDEAMRWVDRQKVQKLLLPLERYGLSPTNPESWLLLSLRLAEKYIKGLRIV